MVNAKQLVQFAKANLNVLLRGKHGVGKTALITEVFTQVFGEHNVKWKYFSAGTMDPWVDFVGIPKDFTLPDGRHVFKVIPNIDFAEDSQVEALFFDEINRADPKVLNALMELIQFRSINGRKFPKLRVIWAAENPAEDGVYMVQPMDPAQKDRFNIQLDIPYELAMDYLIGKHTKEIADIGKAWWEKNKDKVSPRKLDDMLGGWRQGLNVMHFTNDCGTTRELQSSLDTLNVVRDAERVANEGTPEAIRAHFTVDFIRKNQKGLAGRGQLFGKIYEHIGGEQQGMLETMGYQPKVSAENIQTMSPDVVNNLVTHIKNRVNFVGKYQTFTSSTIQTHLDKIENVVNKLKFSTSIELRDLVSLISNVGIDDFSLFLFGGNINMSDVGSGHFSEIRNTIENDPRRLAIFGKMIQLSYIVSYEGRDSNKAVSNVGEYWSRTMKSNLMMKLLKRNAVRYKNLAESLSKPKAKIEYLVTDINKIYA